jgi:hypothetical protein
MIGAIWLANAPAAVIASYSAVSLVLVLSALRADWRILIQAAVSLAARLGLAAFYIVPAALQQQWVNISELLDGVANLRANFFFFTNPAVYFAFNHVISITTLRNSRFSLSPLPCSAIRGGSNVTSSGW